MFAVNIYSFEANKVTFNQYIEVFFLPVQFLPDAVAQLNRLRWHSSTDNAAASVKV